MMNRILERLIRQPEPGEGGTYALVESFLQAMLVVPSGGDMVSGEGSFQPVLVEKNDTVYMVVYTSAEAARKTEDMAPYGMTMRGADVLQRIRPDLGIVVSTADGLNLAFEPEFLQIVKRDFEAGRVGDWQPPHE